MLSRASTKPSRSSALRPQWCVCITLILVVSTAFAGEYQDGMQQGKADAKEMGVPMAWVGIRAAGGCAGGVPLSCIGGSVGCLTATTVGALVPPDVPPHSKLSSSDYDLGYVAGYSQIMRRNRALAALGGGAATTLVSWAAWSVLLGSY